MAKQNSRDTPDDMPSSRSDAPEDSPAPDDAPAPSERAAPEHPATEHPTTEHPATERPTTAAKPKAALWKGLVALMLVGAASAGGVVWQRQREEQQAEARRQAAGQAWANMYACVVGEPLGEGESLIERLRLFKLTGVLRAQRNWPSDCASYTQKLHDALDHKGMGRDLKQALIEKFGCGSGCQINDPVREMSGLAAMVRDADLPEKTATVAALPRVKAKLLSKGAFPQLAPANARELDRVVSDDGASQLLLSSRRYGLRQCSVQPDENAPWQCRDLGSELQASGAKFYRAGEELFLRGRMNAQARKVVLDTAGEIVKLKRGLRDGFSMQRSDKDYRISFIAGGHVQHNKEVEQLAEDHGYTIVGESLLWVRPGETGSQLMTRQFLPNDKVAGEARALGAVPSSVSKPLLCKNGNQRVALYGPVSQPAAMVFFDGSRWSKPVAAGMASAAAVATKPAPKVAKPKAVPGDKPKSAAAAKSAKINSKVGDFGILGLLQSDGSEAGDVASPWGKAAPKKSRTWSTVKRAKGRRRRLPNYAFACGAGEGVITWRVPGTDNQTIAQLRCTPAGCSNKRARLSGLSVKAWWTAATLGEKVLVVWRTELGDLRMRLAPIDQLPDAPDVLIMDTEEHGGPVTRDLAAVIGRDAVVFLFRGDGTHGLRFDQNGDYAPVLLQH